MTLGFRNRSTSKADIMSARDKEIVENTNKLAEQLGIEIEVKTMDDVLTFLNKCLGYE
ncbi:hypothetical protein [Salmonella phage FrontPhageNews]|nr:hypothetical protein [Salmonella phage AR2819]QPX74355.1 hypothetical protein [Salmonella phage FrontPhageNews]QPX74628.1 hypothetical protein Sajous1_95 [Salmonella phage Sajous1]QPX74919.1 hypothetical protein [Salmonella phage SilasIsHot]WDS51260.1 hypothetical protein SeF3a_179 [Salmonella phage SeF3a]WDS51496.1 hypothetical protein SeF6a_182 [Salmonella phage SeF6a]